MRARWVSLAVGLWLLVAPLVLGYPTAVAVLHEVALGLLVCVAALAAIEWPLARAVLAMPALWLLVASAVFDWESRLVTSNELACGAVVLASALVPGARVPSERATAKMAA